MSTPVLWQFRGSHFNEKARWALDWKGIPHVRRSLLPGWHVPRVLSLTRQTKVPVLVRDGGEVVADSTRIIERLEAVQPDPPLYPADPAERRRALELEELLRRGDRTARAARCSSSKRSTIPTTSSRCSPTASDPRRARSTVPLSR